MLYGEILLECAFKGLTKVLGQGGAQAVALELQLGKNGMSPLEIHERLSYVQRGDNRSGKSDRARILREAWNSG